MHQFRCGSKFLYIRHFTNSKRRFSIDGEEISDHQEHVPGGGSNRAEEEDLVLTFTHNHIKNKTKN